MNEMNGTNAPDADMPRRQNPRKEGPLYNDPLGPWRPGLVSSATTASQLARVTSFVARPLDEIDGRAVVDRTRARATGPQASDAALPKVFYEPDIDELVVARGDSPSLDLVDIATDIEAAFDHKQPGRLILATIRGARLRAESDPWTKAARTLVGETVWALYCALRDQAEDSYVRTARTEATSTTVSMEPEEHEILTEVWSALHVSYDDPDDPSQEPPPPSRRAGSYLLVTRPPEDPLGDEVDLWPSRQLVLSPPVAEMFGLETPGTVEFRNAFTVSVSFGEVGNGTATPHLDIVEPLGTASDCRRDDDSLIFEFDLDHPATPGRGLSFLLSAAGTT